MTGDLLIVTPSRARPANIARLLQATHTLSRAETHVHVAIDDDDPEAEDYERVFARYGGEHDVLESGPRQGLIAWTNLIAVRRADEYTCLASFGDDHVPRTRGFDRALVTACTENGPAIAYPFDGLREDIPEAPVVHSAIVQALGWLLNPACDHFYGDDSLGAVGRGAGCLRYLRAIAVDHVHPSLGTAVGDETYRSSSRQVPADKAAYQLWRKERMATDVATVRAVRERALQAA